MMPTTPATPTKNEAATFTWEELQLAARNHAMPLEALRYDITPAGLHYVLIHYDIPAGDAASWHLQVDGAVLRPLDLTLADLMARPAVTQPVTLECAGNGRALLEPRPLSQPWLTEAIGTAAWTGTPLAPILREIGLNDSAVEVCFTGADQGIEGGIEQFYQRSLPLSEALRDDVLLVYAMNGMPLLPQHGAPLRLIVPGWYGMTHVKWLRQITVLTEPFQGYQQARGYHLRATPDDAGTPVTRISPRALLVPPGIPDFMTRVRYLTPGPHRIFGRAWSGWGAITSVDLSTDGGDNWHEAALGAAPAPNAWHEWSFTWDATPGSYDLCASATDAVGNTQTIEPEWNTGGYMNNAFQHVAVIVR